MQRNGSDSAEGLPFVRTDARMWDSPDCSCKFQCPAAIPCFEAPERALNTMAGSQLSHVPSDCPASATPEPCEPQASKAFPPMAVGVHTAVLVGIS